MDGDRGDLAELVKKRNRDYDFPSLYTNKFHSIVNVDFFYKSARNALLRDHVVYSDNLRVKNRM